MGRKKPENKSMIGPLDGERTKDAESKEQEAAVEAVADDKGSRSSYRNVKRIAAVAAIVVMAAVALIANWTAVRNELSNLLFGEVRSNSGVYVGDLQSGVFEGKGTFEFPGGETYSGDWVAGAMNGDGVLHTPLNGEYVGEFHGGQREGEGTYTWPDGDIYKGKWINDMMQGDGEYTFHDGKIARGVFQKNGLSDGTIDEELEIGTCSLRYEQGDPVSLHLSSNGLECVFAIERGEFAKLDAVFPDGLKYSGGFSDGVISGKGDISYPSGDVYSGSFANGKRNGRGTYAWASGGKYIGEWVDDVAVGRGAYYYPANIDAYKVEGQFVNGVPEGECTYYQNESTSYKTTWSNGKCIKVSE